MLLSKEYTLRLVIRVYLITAFVLIVYIKELWLLIALIIPVLAFFIYALLKKKEVVDPKEENS